MLRPLLGLVCGAALALGACTTTPAPLPVLENATASSRVTAERGVGDNDRYPFTGEAWADTDGDGLEDVYFTAATGPNVLLRNLGDGMFELSQWVEDVDLPLDRSGRAIFGDVDGDGWPDLAVATLEGVVLFHNLEGAGFADVTDAAGLGGAGSAPVALAWGDADGDGRLDLYVAHGGCPACAAERADRLYRNLGDGTFADVTASLAADLAAIASTDAVLADVDGDGRADPVVTGDPSAGGAGLVVAAPGASVPDDVAGSAWRAVHVADLDGDGTVDLVLAGSSGIVWLRGDGAAGFAPAGDDTGPGGIDATGVAVADLDADGRLDLYVSVAGDSENVVLLQSEPGRFVDASASAARVAGHGGSAAASRPDASGRVWLAVGGLGARYQMLRRPP